MNLARESGADGRGGITPFRFVFLNVEDISNAIGVLAGNARRSGDDCAAEHILHNAPGFARGLRQNGNLLAGAPEGVMHPERDRIARPGGARGKEGRGKK